MIPFHRLDFRVFCQGTEVPERVAQALSLFVGDREVHEEIAEGYSGNELRIMTSRIEDKRGIAGVWRRMAEAGILGTVAGQLDQRTDEECNVFVRFGKQQAYNGVMGLEKEGGVVEMRAKVAAYPAKRENAIEVAREYFDTLL